MGRDREFGRGPWDVSERDRSLVYSDRSEHLLDALAQVVWRERQVSAFQRVDVVVPHRDVETWCRLGLAQRLGVIANVEFMLPPRFFRRVASALSQSQDSQHSVPIRLMDRELLLEHLLFLFFSPTASADLPLEVKRYLGNVKGDESALSRGRQLAWRLSELFVHYDEATDFLVRWQRHESVGFLPGSAQEEVEAWQSKLWRLIRTRLEKESDQFVTLCDLSEIPLTLPHAAFFFAVPTMPLAHLKILDALWKLTDRPSLHVFAFNPCREDWSDIRDRRTLAGLRLVEPPPKKNTFGDDGCEGSQDETHLGGELLDVREDGEEDASGWLLGNPLLMSLGKAGREHIRSLNELSEFSFQEAFFEDVTVKTAADSLDATAPTLLEQLQSDIRNNVVEPLPWPHSTHLASRKTSDVEHSKGGPPSQVSGVKTALEASDSGFADGSIQILSCTGVRRECEEVAAKVLALFQGNQELRFGDVAILVASRTPKPYFTNLMASLKALGIPVSCSELLENNVSRLPEAAERLIRLPLSGLKRSDVMDLLSHPCLMAHTPALDRTFLARLVDDLGIFYGLDRDDQQVRHGAKYLSGSDDSRTRDLFNWRQGLKRMALGLTMWGDGCGGGDALGTLAGTPFFQAEQSVGGERLDDFSGTTSSERNFSQAAQGGEVPYWPATLPSDLRCEVMLWLQMVQSLLSDVGFASDGNRSGGTWQTVGDWSAFIESLIDTYLVAQKGEEAQKAALLKTARQLRHIFSIYDFDAGREIPVPYSVAAALFLEKLGTLRDETGHFLLDGVSVSGLFRAVPTKHLFIVGLNAGEFPEQAVHDQLDLANVPLKKFRQVNGRSSRSNAVRRFLVTPQERDRYLFLQGLMQARQCLVLSFQGRDQQTGEPKDPSSPLSDVERVLSAYLPHQAPCFRQVVTPRRCDLENFPALQKLTSSRRAPQENFFTLAAQKDVSKGTDAMGEAAVLTLREILKSWDSEAMSRGMASSDLTKNDQVKALFQTENFREIARPSEEILALSRLFEFQASQEKSSSKPPKSPETLAEEMPLPSWNVRISVLAKFLEDPAQGSASGRLGLWAENEDDTNDARFHRSDEAFSLDNPLLTSALTNDVLGAFLTASDVPDALMTEAFWEQSSSLERHVAQGNFPAGIFGQCAQADLAQDIQKISEHLLAAMETVGISLDEVDFHRFGLGAESTFDETITPLEPLELPERVEVLDKAYAVKVTGKLQLLGPLKGHPRQVVALQFKRSKPDVPIRAFVSGLAYIASQSESDLEPFSLVCGCIGGSDPKFELYRSKAGELVTAPQARAFLAQLSAQMLSGPNDYWMPASKVVANLKKSDALGEILKALSKSGERKSFGPLSQDKIDALRVPSMEELTSALEGRWGFFAQRMEKVAKMRRTSRAKKGVSK